MPQRDPNERQPKTIKFDMSSDDDVRQRARKGYEIAKIFKEAGLKIKKIVPASTELSMMKIFKLPKDTKLLCLEIVKSPDPEKSFDDIGEVKDQLMMLDNIVLVDEKEYKYSTSNIVYRFLLKLDK